MKLLVFGGALASTTYACTTLVVGKAASADGSVLLTHSDDGENNGDARLCEIPAASHLPGKRRPIYFAFEDYPRYVGRNRGPCYMPTGDQKPYVPIGHIPQVSQTYAYYEATYGLVNEHGVGIGESTCSGVFGTKARGYGGNALLSIDSLSRIALERTKSARDAVKLMGQLSEKYGFYGAGSFEGSAESLIVGDADEAFFFHILPDPSGTSSIWAAQRVPDDHVGVVANMFVIRDIDFNDSENFLFSSSVKSVALHKGWWTPADGKLDFTRIYSDGEYASKFYSGRRMWGAYHRFGVEFPSNYSNLRYEHVYPASAKPGKPNITIHDLFSIHRYHYEGTQFDMTKGLAAGPFGNPTRFTTTSQKVKGNWERSIGLFRTSCTHVAQLRRTGQNSILWFGPHATSGTVFVPFPANHIRVPAPYSLADPNHLSRQSAYWAHRYVFNIAKIRYDLAQQDVQKLQLEMEKEGEALVAKLDTHSSDLTSTSRAKAYTEHAEKVMKAVWALPDIIIAKYADGYLSDGDALGYPDWWLKAVGYEHGPPPPPQGPSVKYVGISETAEDSCDDNSIANCIAKCPKSGFAACAVHCTRNCKHGAGQILV